ncbi:hypothetical protein QQ045_001804 [Rhodiola kirilowii]
MPSRGGSRIEKGYKRSTYSQVTLYLLREEAFLGKDSVWKFKTDKNDSCRHGAIHSSVGFCVTKVILKSNVLAFSLHFPETSRSSNNQKLFHRTSTFLFRFRRRVLSGGLPSSASPDSSSTSLCPLLSPNGQPSPPPLPTPLRPLSFRPFSWLILSPPLSLWRFGGVRGRIRCRGWCG